MPIPGDLSNRKRRFGIARAWRRFRVVGDCLSISDLRHLSHLVVTVDRVESGIASDGYDSGYASRSLLACPTCFSRTL